MSHGVKTYGDHVKMSSLHFIAALVTQRMWEPLLCSRVQCRDPAQTVLKAPNRRPGSQNLDQRSRHGYLPELFVFLHNEPLNLRRKSLKRCQEEPISRWYQAADFFFFLQRFWFVFQKEFRRWHSRTPITPPVCRWSICSKNRDGIKIT